MTSQEHAKVQALRIKYRRMRANAIDVVSQAKPSDDPDYVLVRTSALRYLQQDLDGVERSFATMSVS
jgi:hypothetical protein